jgi:TfoX/Sxy family transcriptional regulator of competence genes
MPTQTRIFLVTKSDTSLKDKSGKVFTAPQDWANLPAGDASVTRKLKSLGPTWTVQEKKGRKTFSHGVWAAKEHIQQAKSLVETQRSDPKHQQKLAQAKVRREEKEDVFGEDFQQAIITFLNFDNKYQSLIEKLSLLVKEHAVPVGSGTVARSSSVSLNDKAALAVMAWMRHQTSNYDSTPVPRIKGARRELRQEIARQSTRILAKYRSGKDADLSSCPLYKALKK